MAGAAAAILLLGVAAGLAIAKRQAAAPLAPTFSLVSVQPTCVAGQPLLSYADIHPPPTPGPGAVYRRALPAVQNYTSCTIAGIFRNAGGDGSAVAVFHVPTFRWRFNTPTDPSEVVTETGPEATCTAVIARTRHGDVVTSGPCTVSAQPRSEILFPVPLQGVSVTFE